MCTRSFIPHRAHATIGVFAALSVATACLLPDGPAAEVAVVPDGSPKRMLVEHPTGASPVSLVVDGAGTVTEGAIISTARLLFSGQVHVPARVAAARPPGSKTRAHVRQQGRAGLTQRFHRELRQRVGARRALCSGPTTRLASTRCRSLPPDGRSASREIERPVRQQLVAGAAIARRIAVAAGRRQGARRLGEHEGLWDPRPADAAGDRRGAGFLRIALAPTTLASASAGCPGPAAAAVPRA